MAFSSLANACGCRWRLPLDRRGRLVLLTHKAHALSATDTIVLADFVNTTGDTVFDGTLRQGLAVQLEQSPFLSIISDQSIQQTLRMMKQSPDARLTPEIAREVCQREGSAAVLGGSIAQIGTRVQPDRESGELLDWRNDSERGVSSQR